MLYDPGKKAQERTRRAVKSVLALLERRWFDGQFEDLGTWGERAIVMLLLSAYGAYERGSPIKKTDAMIKMSATNGKTSNRYIMHAIRRGLIREEKAPDHGRIIHLIPTPALKRMVEHEMRSL